MLKHVGKSNQKKVVILYREVPGEDHMCLVVYSDSLPSLYHDEVMKVLESPAGQQAESFADALFRHIMADGKSALQALHTSGFIKKVPANQVVVTPNSKSNVRLDELNKILKEMSTGKDAAKRMTEIESGQAEASKSKTNERFVGEPNRPAEISNDVLSDEDLARQRIDQAARMKADAERLLKEAEVLLAEAAELSPKTKTNEPKAKKRTSTKTKAN
jgi:hypothetical protein